MITDYTMASKSSWRNSIGGRLFWLGTDVTAIGWHFYRSEMRRTHITQRIARAWFHVGREIEAMALRIAG